MRLDEVVRRGRKKLEGVCDEPLREVRYLVESLWGFERGYQYAHGDEEVDFRACEIFFGWIERRCEGEPLSLIVGRRAFYGLWFEVTRDTLHPRPESEVLVDWALEFYEGKKKPSWVVDLGTGSGCLLVSLLKNWEGEGVKGLGLDKSEAAIKVARRNGERNGVSGESVWMVGHWRDALGEEAWEGEEEVLVLSNPPYVKSGDREFLCDSVRRFEPRLAWDGGEDGLESIREVMGRRCLGRRERLLMEIGWDQLGSVREEGERAGFRWCGCRRDLGGGERSVMWERGGTEKA